MRRRVVVVLLAVSLVAGAGWLTMARASDDAWPIGPFTRPATGNPVIAPNAASVFIDPIRKAPIHWEALHTFNPAAMVRNGKVDVLYRAEDDTGAMQIGMHTSRLGLAESDDGVHFRRRPRRSSIRPRTIKSRASGPEASRIPASSKPRMGRMY